MKKTALFLLTVGAVFSYGFIASTGSPGPHFRHPDVTSTMGKQIEKPQMKLGAFSVSLSVKDIETSKKFYENLGFAIVGGELSKKYLIMKNDHCMIGLFQGMFEGNILTFNPGWDENTQTLDHFEDVRDIQRQLKGKGIKFQREADENSSGPASFVVLDPDGNAILLDQHVGN